MVLSMLVGHVGIGKVLLCFIVLNVVVVTPRLCERYWAVLVYVVSQALVLGWESWTRTVICQQICMEV